MNFTTLDAAFFTALFLVPGYITNSVIEACVTRIRLEAPIALIRMLALSGVNFMLNAYFIREHGTVEGQSTADLMVPLFLWVWVLFVSPMILGGFLGKVASAEWPQAMLKQIRLNPRDPTPTGWDRFFQAPQGKDWSG